MNDSSGRAERIVNQARAFADPERARQFVSEACGNDLALRQAVESLLAESYRAVPDPALAPPASPAAPPSSPAGPTVELASGAATQGTGASTDAAAPPVSDERIGGVLGGRYKLLEQLGEGGMGSVYMAEQREPVKRLVAVKVIKAGMDSKDILARFEAERQALAIMDHPNIARVLDAGTTSRGSPFFVMELVKGVPITEFCDARKMPLRARLALFVEVCQAIQHAHQKGIIHRDIKPSNVLVALYDDRPVPKVIDFGVAKATGPSLTSRTLVTGLGVIVGTPEYMSPEQATLNQLDVDTRSDVYSLGVLLHELLTGTTPLGRETLRGGALLEILRMIREDEPARPSTKLVSSNILPSVAATRSIEPGKLAQLIKGELDSILLKALEKDRARRYDSANAFAADVERYLGGEPVVAVPASAAYRLRKLLRRNKGTAAAIAATTAALLFGLVAFAWQAQVARNQRDLAIQAREAEADQRRVAGLERDRALRAEADARARADELELVADFQAGLLEQIDPTAAGRDLSNDVAARLDAALRRAGIEEAERADQLHAFRDQWSRVNATDAARELIDRTLLRPAAAAIAAKFEEQPLVAAQLRQVLSERYSQLGLYAPAIQLQQQALETRRRILGEDHAHTLESVLATGMLLVSAGKLTEAEAIARETVDRRRRIFGEDHPATAAALNLTVMVLHYQGRHRESEPIARGLLAWWTRTEGALHEETISALTNLAGSMKGQHRYDEGQSYFMDALERARAALGPEHQTTLNLLNNLGTLEQERGRLAEAEQRFHELLALRRRAQGEEHPETLVVMGNLGFMLLAQGKLEAAAPLLYESLDKRRHVLGEQHPITQYARSDVGDLFMAQGQPAAAEPHFREALEHRRRVLGEGHETTMHSYTRIRDVLVRLGRGQEALILLREAAARMRSIAGEDHADTITMTNQHAATLLAVQEDAQAEEILRELAPRSARIRGERDPITCDVRVGLIGALARQSKLEEAYRVAQELWTQLAGEPELLHTRAIPFMNVLRDALLQGGRWDEAEWLAREEVRVRRQFDGDQHAATLKAVARLGVVLQRRDGGASEAEQFVREALEGQRRSLGPEHPDTHVSIRNLWIVLHELGRLAEAEPLLREDLAWQRKTAGATDPSTLLAHATLAEVLVALGRPAEAEPLQRELVGVRMSVHGDDHPETLEARTRLGVLLFQQQKLDESIPIFEDLIVRYGRLAGPRAGPTIQAAVNLAINLRDAGRAPEAIPLFEDSIQVLREAGPPATGMLANVLRDYVVALVVAGRSGDAKSQVPEAIAVLRACVPPASAQLASELVMNAVILLDLGAFVEAEQILREAVTIRDAVAPDVWSTFNAHGLLGETLLGQQRYAEAEPCIVRGYERLVQAETQIPAQGRHWLPKSGERILRLYESWHAAEPGRGHDARLAEWKRKLDAPGALNPHGGRDSGDERPASP